MESRGGGDDDAELRAQLREIGMRVKEVAADGNCFFRAMCDQRWGVGAIFTTRCADTRGLHEVQATIFEPFIEDDDKGL